MALRLQPRMHELRPIGILDEHVNGGFPLRDRRRVRWRRVFEHALHDVQCLLRGANTQRPCLGLPFSGCSALASVASAVTSGFLRTSYRLRHPRLRWEAGAALENQQQHHAPQRHYDEREEVWATNAPSGRCPRRPRTAPTGSGPAALRRRCSASPTGRLGRRGRSKLRLRMASRPCSRPRTLRNPRTRVWVRARPSPILCRGSSCPRHCWLGLRQRDLHKMHGRPLPSAPDVACQDYVTLGMLGSPF